MSALPQTVGVLSLRPATPGDAEALQERCWSSWSIHKVGEMLQRVARFSGRGRGYAVAACVDGHVVGYGQLLGWARVAEISDLIVAEAYRRQGIGTAMIRHLLAIAQEWDEVIIEIGAVLHNSGALALYRRLGFVDDRLIDLDLGQGAEPVIYLRWTAPPHLVCDS
ncbi:MAG TPA: GNAT family N-acetyltransferase [Aggregatilineales bacterium]|nr:GNAT family N-acetyltransferase [Anaerolineales bacterium]HRE46168.1 GNAT family N-acetyltransferase [Aggregatilineales bacterium]